MYVIIFLKEKVVNNVLSEDQRIDMLNGFRKILLSIQGGAKNISDVSKDTGIPRSTIQRWLKRDDFYSDVYELNNCIGDLPTQQDVENWLQNAKNVGHKKGGLISQEIYGYSKNSDGKFSGGKKNRH